LSRTFADTRIAPEYGAPVLYARDAMAGLELANQLMDPAKKESLLSSLTEQQAASAKLLASKRDHAPQPAAGPQRSKVASDAPIPSVPDFEPHVLRDIPLSQVLPFLNRQMLYSKHLGLTGVVEQLLEAGNEKAVKVHAAVEELLEQSIREGLIRPQALYRWFPANGAGEELILFDPQQPDREHARFSFPRQPSGERLCLTDFSRPLEAGGRDNVALFVVTCGQGIRELSEKWKRQGDFLRSHLLQALALELAEATAEFLHWRIRTGWGIVDDPELTMKDIFAARYRGIRVSFGYPACPELSDQRTLFELLKPEQIGVQLTEGYMMDPEASVSALVFHHPEGKYFSAGG
jgi:5-methyltetrahydrofolate--homocysteine methyltransferase